MWVNEGSTRRANHKHTFRAVEQHLTWRLQRSNVRKDGDSVLGTKKSHLAGATALHMHIILGQRRKVALASGQGDLVLASISRKR